MAIHVCSLAKLHDTVKQTGARHVATLINEGTPVQRPISVRAENHLFLGMNDITEPLDGFVIPADEHVKQFLVFVQDWHETTGASTPLVIHCWAGISRSTAGAFIATCALNPTRSEAEIAQELRRRSPSATPNARLVALADAILEREGRMSAAIAAIGRGEEAYEGTPFHLPLVG
jgi:predicted protein tyrosine phosphatase